jgi:hypothetical protein
MSRSSATALKLASGDDRRALVGALAALLLIGIALTTGIYWTLPRLYPAAPLPADAQVREFPGISFTIARGRDTARDGSALVVDALQGRQAAFVHRDFFPAASAPVIEVALSGVHPELTTELYWRTAEAPDTPRFLQLERGAADVTWHLLAGREGWRGQVIELGVVVSGLRAFQPIQLHSLTLQPASRAVLARLLWQDWRLLHPWRQGSTNYYRGAAEHAPLTPVAVASVWMLGALVLVLALARWRRWPPAAAVAAAVLTVMGPWLALDGLWQQKLVEQVTATQQRYGGLAQAEKRRMEDDTGLRRQALELLDALAPIRGKRAFLVHDSSGHNYHRLRLQYHLLPMNVYNFGATLPDPSSVRPGDHVLLLDEPASVRFDRGRGLLDDGEVTLPAEPMARLRRVSLFRIEAGIRDERPEVEP